jgi:hypothetical protein
MKTRAFKFWLLGLAAIVALTVQLRAATVTATLDPAEVSLGDSTQLTVTVSGSQEQPSMPNIDGLVIQSVSQGTQISIINGSMTSSASVTYQITPQRAGTFTIPALQAGGAKSDPVTLRVTNGSGNLPPAPVQSPQQAQAPTGNGPVVMPPNVAPDQDTAPTPAPAGRFGSIVLRIPKTEFYEGELAPAEIRVLLPGDVRSEITDLPQFTSDGFTLTNLSPKPEQTQEEINGREYTVFTWHTALTAVKSGDFTLNFTVPLTVVVPQQMPQMDDDDAINNMLRNPFTSIFGEKKEVKLTSTPQSVKVLPLPQANRPADFGGAVGEFEAESSVTPNKVNVGDPATLKLKISGVGNFDRVASDMLPSDANWKTYSPKSHFEPLDSAGFQGTKTFEQPIIANNGSITSVPSLSFSYFDPEKRQYATLTTPPIPISVSGSAAVAPPAAPASNPSVATTNPTPAPVAPVVASDLRLNRIEPGTFVSTLEPIYLNPIFMAGQALPLLALLGGLALIRRQRHLSHPDQARLSAMQQAVRQQMSAMDAAMREGQADAFFVHARNALQQRFGPKWKMPPEAITVTDVEARLGGEGQNVRSIFEMADQATYSDLHFEEADLQKWREVVVNELAEAKR